MLETIKYSFVLPAYKAKFLKEAIDSIINQTYADFELVIVNDASPEDIDSIVKSYDDKRIRYYVNEKNVGGESLVAQWNHSITYANGEYLILASDDDIYDLTFLEKMDTLVDKYPDVNVFRPRVKRVDHTGKIIHIDGYMAEYLTQLEYLLAWTSQWIGSGIPFCIFKRKALLEIGGFVNYPMAWFSDDATILKLCTNGIAIYGTECLFTFRYSNENISTALNSKKTLTNKYRATKMFYDDNMEYIKNYKPKNHEEDHILRAIKSRFPRLIKKNKIRSQLMTSKLSTIISTMGEGKQIDCNSIFFMLKCCKYPIKRFFKSKK
jgi:glycosyltransferase involved in cell wall biosynthesis